MAHQNIHTQVRCDVPHYYTAQLLPQQKSAQVQTHYAIRLPPKHQHGPNLSIGRNWMETIEEHDGPGAYDVLRCDIVGRSSTDTSFKVWGQKYHLNRLEQSYRELVTHLTTESGMNLDEDTRSRKNLALFDERCLETAHEQSKIIITALLDQMKITDSSHFQEIYKQHPSKEDGEIRCEIMRVTLLWTPAVDMQDKGEFAASHSIVVRGHLSSSGQVMAPYQIPKSIVATLALPNIKEESTSTSQLPDRHICPYAKISSWSKNRKSLEKKESFMPEGVGEVLLLQKNNSEVPMVYEILEGLTSNFFAIYRDGTIRTAQEGILFGYVRHLVLQCAPKCGLKVDNRPILLEDGTSGDWEETFITSSSRLIYPIREILIPDYTDGRDKKGNNDGLNWKTFWTCKRESQVSKWSEILNEILKCGGY